MKSIAGQNLKRSVIVKREEVTNPPYYDLDHEDLSSAVPDLDENKPTPFTVEAMQRRVEAEREVL